MDEAVLEKLTVLFIVFCFFSFDFPFSSCWIVLTIFLKTQSWTGFQGNCIRLTFLWLYEPISPSCRHPSMDSTVLTRPVRDTRSDGCEYLLHSVPIIAGLSALVCFKGEFLFGISLTDVDTVVYSNTAKRRVEPMLSQEVQSNLSPPFGFRFVCRKSV